MTPPTGAHPTSFVIETLQDHYALCSQSGIVTSRSVLDSSGSRHIAGAAITVTTGAVAVVVSESSTVRVFCHGKLMGEIIPELWLMGRYEVQMKGPVSKENVGDMAVFTHRRGGRAAEGG